MITEWWEIEDDEGKRVIVYTENIKIKKIIEKSPSAYYMAKDKNNKLKIKAIQYICKLDDATHWELKQELGLKESNQRVFSRRRKRN